MQFRDRGLSVDDRARVASGFSVALVLLVVLALVAAGGIAQALPVLRSQSSEIIGLETDLSTPLMLLPSNPVGSFDAYVSTNGAWPLEGSTGSTSVEHEEPLFGDLSTGNTSTLVPVDLSPLAATMYLSGTQSADEGDGMTFVVSVDGYFDGSITGAVFTSGEGDGFGGTATPGVDYFQTRKSFSFSGPGEMSIYVPTYEDDVVEPDEYFKVIVTSTSLVGDLRTEGWILNDDSASVSGLSVDDATVTEGDTGTTTASFTVSLAPASTSTVTVDYSTCGVECDPAATATGGDDYEIAVDSLTFAPGETSKTIPVTINGDTVVEPDEIFFMGLGDATGATITDSRGRGTIVDDDNPAPPPPPSGTFVDDDSSVFESDIEWMAAEGITKGCNPPVNDKFCPDANVTRGQMAAFLVRALGLTERLLNPFVDDDDSIFEADIERLAAAGITKGCNPPTNDRFCPDGKVTREQMAAFLVRALGYTDNGGGDLFTDDDDSIFEADIDRLGTAGVTKGCNPPTNDRFCPGGNVTRGQMAAFLHRALG